MEMLNLHKLDVNLLKSLTIEQRILVPLTIRIYFHPQSDLIVYQCFIERIYLTLDVMDTLTDKTKKCFAWS